MSEFQTCGKCGAQKAPDGLEGLCSACLAQLVVGNVLEQATEPPHHQRFGDYELLEEIAHGGMGVVHRARQISLNRIVAVKMIRGDRLARLDDIRRFHTEAQAAASLQHPGIVAIHEVGEVDGQYFYSMDFVEGTSLAEVARDHPLSAKNAARYVKAIAEAIQYAHGRHVLHRDLKPSNVLIDRHDHPRVTDFGLAKLMQEDSELTLSGTVMGSPSYMSPEQARGRVHDVTVRSDVYALGAILYDLVTGRPPFQAETPLEILWQVSELEPISPRLLNPNLPRDLETVCLKCLDKSPGKRYDSAQELAEDLGRFLRHEPITARPVKRPERLWRWCRRKPWAAAAILLACAGLGGVLSEWRRAEFEQKQSRESLARLHRANGIQHMQQGDLLSALPSLVEALRLEHNNPTRQRIDRLRLDSLLREAPRLSQLWIHDDFVTAAAFSPDGRLVITGARNGQARLFSTVTGEPATPTLPYHQPVFLVRFSPDGSRVLTAYADQTAQLWDATTGRPVGAPLAHRNKGREQIMAAVFSRDGRLVLSGGADGAAMLWLADTGEPAAPPIPHPGAVNYVDFHPAGEQFVVATTEGSAWIRDLRPGNPMRRVLRHPRALIQAKFSPDGRRLLTVCADNTSQLWDTITADRIGPPLHNSSGRPEQLNPVQPTGQFSPDSRWVATSGTDRTARIWSADTGLPITPPLRHSHSVVQVDFSPDSRYLVTSSHDHRARIWEITRGEVWLTLKHNGFVLHSAFSPDGHRILTASQDRTAKLWDLAAARSALPPAQHADAINGIEWSPDGRLLATASRDRTAVIWDAQTGAQRVTLAHEREVFTVRFDADARRVVTSCRDGSARVWEVSSGRLLQTLPHSSSAVTTASFSPDGRTILTASEDGTARLWDSASGASLKSLPRHRGTIRWAAFSSDGKLAVTAGGDLVARIFDVGLGQAACPPLTHAAEVRQAVFSPDNRKLLTVCADAFDPHFFAPRAGQLWEVATGQPVGPPLQHSDGVLSAAFTPDGRFAATAGEDGMARIWEVRTGRLMTQPLRHDFHIWSVQFSPDGRLLLTAGRDGTARLWDVQTGQPAMPSVRLSGLNVQAAFNPNGRSFITFTEQGRLEFWRLGQDNRSLDELTQLGQALTGEKLDPLAGATPTDLAALQRLWGHYRKQLAEDSETTRARVLAWHRLEADQCLFQGLSGAAIVHLDRVLTDDPLNHAYLTRRAQAHLVQQQRSSALADASAALEAGAPTRPGLQLRATILEQMNQPLRAIPDLTTALQSATVRRHRIELLTHRARLYSAGAQPDAAAADLEQALKLEPDQPRLCNNLAWLHLTAPLPTPDPNRAGRLALRAVSRDKTNPDYLRTLGVAQYRLDQYEEALQTLEASARTERTESSARLYFQSMASSRLRDGVKAREFLQQARAWQNRRSEFSPLEQGELERFELEAAQVLALPALD